MIIHFDCKQASNSRVWYEMPSETGSGAATGWGEGWRYDTGSGWRYDTGSGWWYETGSGWWYDTGSGWWYDTGSGWWYDTGSTAAGAGVGTAATGSSLQGTESPSGKGQPTGGGTWRSESMS